MGKLKDKQVIVFDKYIDTLNNLSSDIDQELTFATDIENLCSVAETIIICNGAILQ